MDITVARSERVLTIPIQCLTVRDEGTLQHSRRSRRLRQESEIDSSGVREDVVEDEDSDKQKDIEGVFVVEDGSAGFTPVEVGIAGEKYFEVKTGLSSGLSVVSGPFKVIGELRDGEAVKLKKKPGKRNR